jgi:ADP-heptose:LPS heptosyltransferase
MTPQKILISRTDKIGDVVLTLPLAGFLKRALPGAKIAFLGQKYTRPVVESCTFVDEFHDWGEIHELAEPERLEYARVRGFDAVLHVFPNREVARWARRAGIALRVGTTHRLFHLWTCNRWLNLSRRHSPLHEAQLNIALARPLVAETRVTLEDISPLYGLQPKASLPSEIETLLVPDRFNLVLHPKSKGSAREWPLESFAALAKVLPRDRFQILVTGGPDEKPLLAACFPEHGTDAVNLAGRLSLAQLLTLISRADGLVAASTGPLHLAAATGRYALGIYPPIEPMHPARWGPLGPRATAICVSRRCDDCRHGGECACMRAISVAQVQEHVERWQRELRNGPREDSAPATIQVT